MEFENRADIAASRTRGSIPHERNSSMVRVLMAVAFG
jgi:hypothetical protein